jgi:quinol monooxygenase YgiN
MSQVAVIAKISVLPGKRAEAIVAFQQALDNAAGEPGTLQYVLHEDAKDADLLWFYELYSDQAALDAHATSDGMKALGPVLRPFMAARSELTILTPVGGKGLPA